MHLIVYVSDCAVSGDALEETLRAIVAESLVNNRRDGITGVLFCENGHFLQFIEGEEAELRRCFGRIQADSRHRNIVTLVDEPVPARSFPHWTLDTFFIDNPALVNPKTLAHLRDIYVQHFPMDAAELVNFIKSVVDEIDTFKILRTDGQP